jgi:hypothetical protein
MNKLDSQINNQIFNIPQLNMPSYMNNTHPQMEFFLQNMNKMNEKFQNNQQSFNYIPMFNNNSGSNNQFQRGNDHNQKFNPNFPFQIPNKTFNQNIPSYMMNLNFDEKKGGMKMINKFNAPYKENYLFFPIPHWLPIQEIHHFLHIHLVLVLFLL